MSNAPRVRRTETKGADAAGHAPLPPLPAAVTVVLAVFTAVAIVVLVTFRMYDTDMWQHLLVGRAIWTTHAIPHTQVWTWPTYGAPDVLPSWLFRVLVWPVWQAAGVAGLFTWRWATTLATFALLALAARRAGARGAWSFLALFACALLYRYRSQVRPETLVAILVGAQVLVLETRRARAADARGLDPAWMLVPIAILWANLHLSYWMGLALSGFYLLDAFLPGRAASFAGRARLTLALAIAASAVASLLNPFGWRALAQPVEYWLVWRHEPIYRIIGELMPVDWRVYTRSLLPLWLAAVALLALRRWRVRGFDLAQALVIVVFVPQALGTQRFLSYAALLVAPFLARDLEDWASGLRWPAALARPWAQASLVVALMVAAWLPTFGDPAISPGWGLDERQEPVRACDWMRDHDVRGHGFHPFEMGGYLLYRFWPDTTRLPFMDIHQAGTREDRALAAYALVQRDAFAKLDAKYRFDWVMLNAVQVPGERVLDDIDADTTTWALVFRDDAAALFLRREGRFGGLAERERYRTLAAGPARLKALVARAVGDSVVRATLRPELERARDASRWNADLLDVIAFLDLADGRWDAAHTALEAAGTQRPDLYRLHERLGLTWLMSGKPDRALAEFERERRAANPSPVTELRVGQALRALGRTADAKRAFESAALLEATRAEALDSLAAIARR